MRYPRSVRATCAVLAANLIVYGVADIVVVGSVIALAVAAAGFVTAAALLRWGVLARRSI